MGAAGGGFNAAAFKAVPREALRWNIWLAVIWGSYCGGLHGFNTANISGAMSLKPFVRDFGFDKLTKAEVSDRQGWVVSCMLLGQLVGVILSGPLGESKGRKPTIFAAATFYSIGAIMMAANFGSYKELIAGRVFSGLGSGFGMTAGAVYISEIAPRSLRGCMATFYNINIMAGVAGSYWINYGSLQQISSSSSWQWRTTLVLQLIPAIILFLGLPFFPESPRFLMLTGKNEKAKQALLGLRNLPEDHPYFREEFDELQSKVVADAEQEKGLQALKTLIHYCATDPTTLKRVVFVILIQTFFIMSGGNSITYYAPNILSTMGFNSNQVLLFTGVYGLIKVISVLLYAFFLTDRFGRRPLLIFGSATDMLCTLYLSVFLGVVNIKAGAPASPAAWVAIVAICIFAIGYGFGWAPAFSLSVSEICPTRTRGTIVTIAFTYQNVLNFGITRGFPNMVEAMHAWGPFALFTACTFVGTIWVYLAFPECKGQSMESMDYLFMLPWYKVGRYHIHHPQDTNITSSDFDQLVRADGVNVAKTEKGDATSQEEEATMGALDTENRISDAPHGSSTALLPNGGWDVHHHIFELAEFLNFKRKLGLTHSTLTHGLSYGDNCTSLTHFIQDLDPKYTRGIGVLDPETTPDADLQAMRAAGVRGIRVNLYIYKAMDDVERQKMALRAHARRIKDACPGWSMAFTHTHPEFWGELRGVIVDEIAPSGIQLVTDHFALLKAESMLPAGTSVEQQPGFKEIIELVRNGNLWVKLSAPYRVSEMAPGYEDVRVLVRALVDANPRRVLWGSDWPHTPRMKVRTYEEAMKETPYLEVDDEAWLRSLKSWFSNEEWELLMNQNPQELYGG
ncbi:hypothetical protein B7463_g8222, partial [Scytalidium lignicola]